MINKIRKASHPGKYVKESIEALNMTQNEFAIRVGMTAKNLNTLINEKSNITYEVAEKLASFFDNSIDFWTNLQNKYESYLLYEEKAKQIEKDWEIVKYFDKDFLLNNYNIKVDSNNKEETIELLKKLFLVSNLSNLQNKDLYAYCHTGKTKEIDTRERVLRNAWITLAIKKANNETCSKYNEKKLLNSIDEIRKLTLLKPNVFTPKLKTILSSVGIKYIELPYLKNSNISGVSKWISNDNSFVLAVNDYSKYADRIWFTIFHELGHIIRNNKKNISISLQSNNIINDEEKFADSFAENCLINKDDYQFFVMQNDFTNQTIREFAKTQNIHVDIVIGRLERDHYISYGKFVKNKYVVSA